MMKFYIDGLGPKPHVSVGSQALVNATVQIIENRYPGSRYYFMSQCPEIEEEYLRQTGCDCQVIQRPEGLLNTVRLIKQMTAEVDAVVSPWGDAYITLPPHVALRKTFIFKLNKTPLMLMTSSLGPFQSGWKKIAAKAALKKFDVLTVRDTITYDFFRSLGFDQTKLIPDTAFVLRPATPERVQEIYAAEGFSLQEGKYVGLNVSVLLYNRMKKQGKDYISLMCELIKNVKTMTQLPILLIPHQYYSEKILMRFPELKTRLQSEGGDDREIIPMIYDRLTDADQVYAVKGEYSCYEYKGMIKGCAAFIGGRMHSVIASLSSSVPCLIMQYSHKSLGLMTMLGVSEYCWNVQDKPEALAEMVSLLWNTKDAYQKKLEQIMPELQGQTYSSIALLEPFLRNRNN